MSDRPNILMIHCHDLGQHLGCYGVPTVQSPNLDAFAAGGVRFQNSFTVCPTCSPSRAVLYTGLYPPRNGVMGMCPGRMKWDLRPEVLHLAQHLRSAGYATAAIGEHHESCSGPERCGFDTYDATKPAEPAVDAAIAQLAQLKQQDRPFYLQVGINEPHRLHLPDDENDGFIGDHIEPDDELGTWVPGYLKDTPGTREELAELQGAVRHVDTHVGRLLNAVDDLDLRDDTLVIFTTDHGIAMPRSKATLYDPGIEVALMMRLPSRSGWSGGQVVNEMVSNVDVTPTLLELVGVDAAELDGKSFAPLLDGRDYEPRAEVFAEQTYHGQYDPKRGIRTERHKLFIHFSSGHTWQDTSQSWRPRSDPVISRRAPRPDFELYDLADDPWELTNRADDPELADVQADLLARLGQHLHYTADPILAGPVSSPTHDIAMGLLDETSHSA
jgi:N-sulfoglucosamine sulfohydrolase